MLYVRQTLREWSRNHHRGDAFRYLCVCLDPTVAATLDPIILERADLDFRVDTDPSVVRQFLTTNNDAVRVVFSTYQSAPVVGEGMRGLASFDAFATETERETPHSPI